MQKAIRILFHLGEFGPEMGVTQLAGELGLNKATAYRLLNAMVQFERIEKNSATERYRLGLRLHELGSRALESRSLRSEAHSFLMELSRRCNESVSIAVLSPEGVVCLDRVDPSRFRDHGAQSGWCPQRQAVSPNPAKGRFYDSFS